MAKKKRHSLAGKFCSIKSKTQRQKIDPNYELPDGAAGHMVIVFNTPNGYNKAEVASITSNNEVMGINFYPIAPILKKTHGRRLEIKHWNNQHYIKDQIFGVRFAAKDERTGEGPIFTCPDGELPTTREDDEDLKIVHSLKYELGIVC